VVRVYLAILKNIAGGFGPKSLGQKYNCDQTKREIAKEKRRGQLIENGSLKGKIYLQKAKKMRDKYTGILAEGENIIF
jgi:hypothetical protein